MPVFRLELDISKMKSGEQAAVKSLENVSSSADKTSKSAKGASQSLDGLGNKMSALTKTVLGFVGAFSFGDIIRRMGDFEFSLFNVTKVTNESVDSIRKNILALPAALGDATSLTEGYYQVMSAGITDAAKANDMLITASKLAKTSPLTNPALYA